ncbi:SAM-dependent methyltransferase [Aliikangiella sp. IMCC44359]|uniref:SAM-dependent methyltransferase n=1 Tax=Aliikangiella sp. IMCC44359 TaxID=3459125 RepID=UPI00403ADA5D
MEYSQNLNKGKLTIVGCGLHPGHMTLETKSHLETAEIVLLVAPNPLTIQHVLSLNPNVENLGRFYGDGKTRRETYRLMAKRIVELVESGKNVCTAFYGHPGIFVLSTHKAREALEKKGYPVKMLPGISAEDCLFADINLDPASTGCHSFEATQFLLTKRNIDTGAALILWQIGLVGEHTLKLQTAGKQGLSAITQLLMEQYPEDHKVCLYEAATLPGFEPRIDWIKLKDLPSASVKTISTLVIPHCKPLEFAEERLSWLNLSDSDLTAWDEPVDEEVLI